MVTLTHFLEGNPQQGIFYMHLSIDRTVHTTAFDKPVVDHWLEWKIAPDEQRRTFWSAKYINCQSLANTRDAVAMEVAPIAGCIWCVYLTVHHLCFVGARCSSVVRAFTHGAMGHRIDPSWGGPIELFLIPASDPRLVTKAVVCAILSEGWCI